MNGGSVEPSLSYVLGGAYVLGGGGQKGKLSPMNF